MSRHVIDVIDKILSLDVGPANEKAIFAEERGEATFQICAWRAFLFWFNNSNVVRMLLYLFDHTVTDYTYAWNSASRIYPKLACEYILKQQADWSSSENNILNVDDETL